MLYKTAARKNITPIPPVMLNKLANIKWVVEKISQGVRIVAIKKKIEIRQIKEPILAIRYCFLSFLKNVGRAKAKGIKEKLSINAVIVNMVKEITFEAPESAVTRPKSLKKLPQKLYPGLRGFTIVPPA